FQLVDARSSSTRMACAEARSFAAASSASYRTSSARQASRPAWRSGTESIACSASSSRRRTSPARAASRSARRARVWAAVTPLTRSSMLARSVVGPVSGPSSAEGAPAAPAISTTPSVAAGEVAAQASATTGAAPVPMHDTARTTWSNEVTVRPVRPSAAPASAASRGAATTATAPSRATRSSAASTAVTPPYADERTTTALANDPRARSISCGGPWSTRTPGATTWEATSTRAALCSTSTTARRPSAARAEASAAPPATTMHGPWGSTAASHRARCSAARSASAPARIGSAAGSAAAGTARGYRDAGAPWPRRQPARSRYVRRHPAPTWSPSPAAGGSLDCMPSELTPHLAQTPTIADRSNDVYGRLLKERIVFLGTQVDDTIANLICAQLLLLAAEDDDRDVYLYINSPGGSVTAGMAIYDTMQYIGCDVATIC